MKTDTETGGRKPPVTYPSGTWVCPKCGKNIKFLVDMTSPPTCHSHVGNSIVIMERKK